MRALMILGGVLVLFGMGTLVYSVIPIHHTEEVAKIGPITANEDKENDVVIPPYASILALVAGGALVLVARRA